MKITSKKNNNFCYKRPMRIIIRGDKANVKTVSQIVCWGTLKVFSSKDTFSTVLVPSTKRSPFQFFIVSKFSNSKSFNIDEIDPRIFG